MSAYVVDKAHIDVMIEIAQHRAHGHHSPFTWYHNGERKHLTRHTADATGQMLLNECVASVSHRYPSDNLDTLPGRNDHFWTEPYTFSARLRMPTTVEGLKLVRCYIYQSCEHPEWEASEAKAFCDSLTVDLISRLPGYEDAPWEWTESTINTWVAARISESLKALYKHQV